MVYVWAMAAKAGRGQWKTTATFALLFVASRIAYLLLAGTSTYDWEQRYTGGLARYLTGTGSPLPYTDLYYSPWEGGSFVVGVLSTAAMAMVGDRLIALHLVALAFGAVGATALFLVLQVRTNRAAAYWFGVLAIFAPPALLRGGLVAWGSHAETAALACLVLLGVTYVGEARHRAWFGLLFGVICGLVLWFGYLSLAAILGSVLALAWNRVRLPSGTVAAGLVGFALGFLPWWWSRLFGVTRAVEVYGRSAGDVFTAGLVHLPGRAVSLVLHELPASLMLPLWGTGGLYVAVVFVLAIFGLRSAGLRTARLAVHALGFTALVFALIYLASDFELAPADAEQRHGFMNSRYFMLLLWCGLALASAALGTAVRWRQGLGAALVAVSVGSFAWSLWTWPPGDVLDLRAVDVKLFNEVYGGRVGDRVDDPALYLAGVVEPEGYGLHAFYTGFCRSRSFIPDELDPAFYRQLVDSVPGRFQLACAEGVGVGIWMRYNKRFLLHPDQVAALPPLDPPEIAIGLGRQANFDLLTAPSTLTQMILSRPLDERFQWYRGAGRTLEFWELSYLFVTNQKHHLLGQWHALNGDEAIDAIEMGMGEEWVHRSMGRPRARTRAFHRSASPAFVAGVETALRQVGSRSRAFPMEAAPAAAPLHTGAPPPRHQDKR